jgi:beta-galactosidase
MRKVIHVGLFIGVLLIFFSCKNQLGRNVISLNGNWDFEVTTNPDQMPDSFTRKIAVPGLVDMAVPSVKLQGNKNDSANYYWYKVKFKLEKNTPVCLLKLHKAQYSKKIFVNNKLVAEHYPSYTPVVVDIQAFLNEPGTENELVIRLGNYYNFPDSFVNGHDFEKKLFISGIYDDVELIQTSYPLIVNTQIVPDIKNGKITVVTELNTLNEKGSFNLEYIVCEHKSGKQVAAGKVEVNATGGIDTSKVEIVIPEFTHWSPENPFLYDLKLNTGADSYSTRFGMREFYFDKSSGRAMLNGKVFYMNGTNVPLFRFYEDSFRGNHPWDTAWVKKLNEKFKSMNWNTVRYHVGPAPDFWYDLADEMGILVQDEFAIWFGKGMKSIRPNLKAKNIAQEYKIWMRERWNHPSVVIWDAQNETVTEETGKAINMVRHLDLSNRPWDNGWSRPQSDNDAIECHPYLFYPFREKGVKLPKEGILKSLMGIVRQPDNDCGTHDLPSGEKNYTNVRFVNEYGWLWVNRDGSPTTLSEGVYQNLFGDTLTNAQRLYYYARLEAMLTEYWRCHRTCTGVMHFAGLTYSRPAEPRGQTSDNFKNLETLEFEPNFLKYVKPAFAPVALMVDTWEKEYKADETIDIPVYAINDMYSDWTGKLIFTLSSQTETISTQTEDLSIKSLGREIKTFKLKIPATKGKYELKASIILNNEEVASVRDVLVK